MALVFCAARGNRGGTFAATAAASTETVAALWTPSEVTTYLWLDADDSSTITESGGSVSQWDDKSGNDYHAVQGTGSLQPTTGATTLNSKNVLDFAPADDATDGRKLGKTTPDPGDFRDVYLVAKWTSVPNPAYVMLFGGLAAGNANIGFMANGTGSYGGWYNNIFINVDTTSTSGVITLLRSDFLMSFSRDSSPDAEGFQVGAQSTYTTSRIWVGYVAEVVCFSTKLGADDKETMEGYLAHKWGIEGILPADHTYKGEAPTQGT